MSGFAHLLIHTRDEHGRSQLGSSPTWTKRWPKPPLASKKI